jgi:hypothetical protein
MNSSTQKHTGASNPSIISNRTYSFTNTIMIDGGGKEWTTASQTVGGNSVTMPNPDGGTISLGRCGNGYCRITVTFDS